MTTLEVSNLGRYGFMGGKGGSSMSSQSGFMEARAAAALRNTNVPVDGSGLVQHQQNDEGDDAVADDEVASGVSTPTTRGKSSNHHGHHHGGGTFTAFIGGSGNWLLSIVGLDLYTKGKGGEGLKKASRSQNPFDHGLVINCQDFWTRGRALGVKYEDLYDIPPGGFKPSLRGSSHQRTDSDLESGGGGSLSSRRWSMWSSVKRSLPRRGGGAHEYSLLPGDQNHAGEDGM
jgi:hypothetical protein